jgi:hypothetical protein
MPGFIGDFDGAVIERATMQQLLAQHFPACGYGFLSRRFDVWKVLTFGVFAEL